MFSFRVKEIWGVQTSKEKNSLKKQLRPLVLSKSIYKTISRWLEYKQVKNK